jgi:hypothetical protein
VSRNLSTVIIAFLILALIASLFLVFRTTVFFGRAATLNSSPIVLENSYLFASPLQAKADGKEMVRITIFLLDGRGLGVANKNVTLNLPSTVTTTPTQPTTDDTGKAIFDLSSTTAGKLEVQAQAEGKPLPQKVRVVFY